VNEARLTDRAAAQLEAIYEYTAMRWDDGQAERYTREILRACGDIAKNAIISRPIDPELALPGFVARQSSHYIYWRRGADGDIDILAILHERMMQATRLRDTLEPD
jgi:toxin ParE1/3/4